MNAQGTVRLGAALLLACLGWLCHAATPAGSDEHSRLQDRLNSLRPDRPMEYFELGEEVADTATTDEDHSLARHLFALAGVLDARRLGRSACLALADLSEDAQEKRRLLSLAWLLRTPGQRQSISPSSVAGPAEPPKTTAVLAVVDAFSFYRKGEGARALTELRKAGAMELLTRHSRWLPGGHERFLTDCRHYRDRTGPFLTSREYSRMLHLEAALLAGEERTWSGELLLSDGRPLVEVDPLRLEETLRVDRSRPYYREGGWVAAP